MNPTHAPSLSANAPVLPSLVVPRIEPSPPLDEAAAPRAWARAGTTTIGWYHPRSSSHRPAVQVRLSHDGTSLTVGFTVADRYVRCAHTMYQAAVCEDSCVEFFLQPRETGGYFNFELNAGGTLLLYHIRDTTRGPDGRLANYSEVPWDLARTIELFHTLPQRIETEIAEPVTWRLSARVPLSLFEAFLGPLPPLSGQRWRANFYKCASHTSHPHWGSWAPVGDRLDFHQPETFGALCFE